MDSRWRLPGHCHRIGVWHRPYAEPGKPKRDGQQHIAARSTAKRSGESNLFTDADESASEPGPDSCAGAAAALVSAPRDTVERPRSPAGRFLCSHHSIGSRVMSSGARVTVTPLASLRRTTFTVPAYSGDPE